MANEKDKICVVGLGYVGLPLAVEFAKQFEVIGFDIDKIRVENLNNHLDWTGEIPAEELKESTITSNQ